MPLYQLWNWLNLMRNRQPTARRPNSPTKHVFSAAKAHELPLPAAWPNRIQATDTQWIFAVKRALFRGRNAFFPCRQGKIATGPSHWPEPAVRRRDPVGEDRIGGGRP